MNIQIDAIRNFVNIYKNAPWECIKDMWSSEKSYRSNFPSNYNPKLCNLSLDLLIHFNHLYLKPGYILDYVLYLCGPGGDPWVYSRKYNSEPLEEIPSGIYSSEDKFKPYEYLDSIVLSEKCRESYLELVILKEVCSQFYLYWHDHYREFTFLFDNKHINELIDNNQNSQSYDKKFDQQFINNLLNINCSPEVEIKEKQCVVKLKGFRLHGGIVERTYTIPVEKYSQIATEDKELLNYYPGYIY